MYLAPCCTEFDWLCFVLCWAPCCFEFDWLLCCVELSFLGIRDSAWLGLLWAGAADGKALTTEIHCLMFLEAGTPRWRCRQGFLGLGGTICSCLCPSFSWFAGNTSCSWLVVTLISTFMLTLCVQVCVQMSPCRKDISGAHSALAWHLDWLYLHRPYFQIRSRSERLRVRPSVDEFWGTQIAAEEVSPRLRLGNLSSTFRV